MKYPRKSPYLRFHRKGLNEYIIEDWLAEETFIVEKKTAMFLKELDGKTDPYEISKLTNYETRMLLKAFKENDFIDPIKKIVKLGEVGSFILPLLYLYPGKILKAMGQTFNTILLFMFVPALVIGVIQIGNLTDVSMHSMSELLLGMLLGEVVGSVVHELAHCSAAITYQASVGEMGIGTKFFIPIAYVLMDETNVRSRFARMQINAAGIEANMLLFALFMWLAGSGLLHGYIFYIAGLVNLSLSLVNALPLEGLDGLKIISRIFRRDDLLSYTKWLVKTRKKQIRKGRVGAVIGAYALLGFQIGLPALFIFEILSIIKIVIFVF